MPGGWLNFQKLKDSRTRLGISQKRVAKVYGCSLGQYRKIESGQEEITEMGDIAEFAKCLSVGTGALVNDDYNQEKEKRK